MPDVRMKLGRIHRENFVAGEYDEFCLVIRDFIGEFCFVAKYNRPDFFRFFKTAARFNTTRERIPYAEIIFKKSEVRNKFARAAKAKPPQIHVFDMTQEARRRPAGKEEVP